MSASAATWTETCPEALGMYWFVGSIWAGPVEMTVIERMPNGQLAMYGQMASRHYFNGIFCPVAMPPHPPAELAQKIAALKR